MIARERASGFSSRQGTRLTGNTPRLARDQPSRRKHSGRYRHEPSPFHVFGRSRGSRGGAHCYARRGIGRGRRCAATTKRFAEQRWALDNIIRANGIDWDQPRSIYLSSPCGVEANADFAAIRSRVQKMADIGPAFESTAKRREAKAPEAAAEGH